METKRSKYDTNPLDGDIAKDLGTKIGDKLVFDVQGILIKTRLASTRTADAGVSSPTALPTRAFLVG